MDIHINYLAVVVAALANYIIGAIWYGVIFSDAWKKMSGITDMKPTPQNIVLGMASALVMSYVLAHAIVFASAYMKASCVSVGLTGGFFNWLGFIATVTLGGVIYEKRPWKLWLLNNAYWLISLLVMGTILSVWR
jgi:hypothetical protein